MGMIVGIGVVIASIAGAALSQQLSDEFKAWTPWIVEKILRRAVRALPPTFRERYDEEWRSHLEDIPGQFGKIWVAIGCIGAAKQIGLLSGLTKPGQIAGPFKKYARGIIGFAPTFVSSILLLAKAMLASRSLNPLAVDARILRDPSLTKWWNQEVDRIFSTDEAALYRLMAEGVVRVRQLADSLMRKFK
jgi:hypothetical protein